MTCGCGFDARDEWHDCLIHKGELTEDDKRWLTDEYPTAVDCGCYSPELMEWAPYPCGRCSRSLLGGAA